MTQTTDEQAWSVLRKFARPRAPSERCELCSAALGDVHPHVLEPATRQLRCCCPACSLLFSSQSNGRYRRVAPVLQYLFGFDLDDAAWDSLHLPINLAFFVRTDSSTKVQAFFPSPAGATESLVTLGHWDTLAAKNPVLNDLEPDVEALLVNRLNGRNDVYRVSIDECYKLAGLIRTRWRGLSGGSAVWEEVGRYFRDLETRSRPPGASSDARSEL